MKILTVGASGYIGHSLHERAMARFGGYGTASTDAKDYLCLRLDSPDEFDFECIGSGDVVFLTAAISSPDVCVREHARAWGINVIGTSEYINRFIGRGARVVFFSSDTVYGERDDKFCEGAVCNPSGEYAVMKNEVEKRFLGNPLFKVVRLSYVFSKTDKFTRYLSGCALRGEVAELFHPFRRAIVHRDDVVEGALALAQRWESFSQEIFNFGGPEVLSRIDFARCLKRIALPNLEFRIIEPEKVFFENRPRVIAMASNILPDLLGRPSRTLFDAATIEFQSS